MKLLRLAPENTKFGFMRLRRVSYPLSACLSIVAVTMFFFVGMNFGIDFAGGTQVELRAKSGAADLAALRAKGEGLGLGPVEAQRSGAEIDVTLRLNVQPGGEAGQQTAIAKLRQAFGDAYEFRSRRGGRARASRANWCRAARSASSSRSWRCSPISGSASNGSSRSAPSSARCTTCCSPSASSASPNWSSTRPRSRRSSPSSAIRSTRRWSCSTASAR